MQSHHFLGANLRHYRLQYHITQEDLGQRTGLHRTYICTLEHGCGNPSLQTIRKLAMGLNVCTWQLLMPCSLPDRERSSK